MPFIPLVNSIEAARVDSEDHAWLSEKGPWMLSSEGYVYRGSKAMGDIEKMHLLVATRAGLARAGKHVDHHNFDKLNMTRDNLRLLSPGDNARKRRTRKPG